MSDRIRAGRTAALELSRTEAAFEAVREAKIKAWIAADDPQERERCHAAIRVLGAVKAELLGHVAAGKVEEKIEEGRS